jgi:hypothetical protein
MPLGLRRHLHGGIAFLPSTIESTNRALAAAEAFAVGIDPNSKWGPMDAAAFQPALHRRNGDAGD